MKSMLILALLFASTAHGYQVQTKIYNTLRDSVLTSSPTNKDSRNVAQMEEGLQEEPLLFYLSPDSKQKNKVYAVNQKTWSQFKKKGNSRLDLFLKLYYANTKSVSNSGQKHLGCFTGNPEALVKEFFNEQNIISQIQRLFVTLSEDRKMIGFEFDYKGAPLHFRLPGCTEGGKNPIIHTEEIKTASHDFPENGKAVEEFGNQRMPAAAEVSENGFEIFDKLNKQDEGSKLAASLPRFKLRADFDKMAARPNSRSWKNMDLRKEANAIQFAHFVLDYFWDSMIQDLKNPNNNLIAQNIQSGKNLWCHMPWLNVGDSGREMIHGLTKERDLEASSIYPEVGTSPEKNGSDWGIGFYNDIACETANRVFGSAGKAQEVPNFAGVQFPDGSVSVKILFTTANLDALQGSFAWHANVSLPKSTSRRLREVKLVQIDIAVKDSSLTGARKEIDGWMMTSFYYDKNYQAPSRHKFTGAFSGLNKMRPIGIQTGFDPATSMIFKGSKTNSKDNSFYGANPQLLNGPADNAKASCLSCHGAAGTSTKMVPGVEHFNSYSSLRNLSLDFSQQLALAKRNFETRSGQKATAKW